MRHHQLGHTYIGTEHILLGFEVGEGEGQLCPGLEKPLELN